MLIRKATMKDIQELRVMYLELESDGVKYQPEHFVIGYREDSFLLRPYPFNCFKP